MTWHDSQIPSMAYIFALPIMGTISDLKLSEGQVLRLLMLNKLTKFPIVRTILQMLPQVILADTLL